MLKPFFDWFGSLAFSAALRESTWLFPIVDALHLVSLAVFAGALLIVDFRLLGGGLKERPLAELSREAQPWLLGGLIGLVLTGVPMLMANGERYYYSDFFWEKMTAVAIALVFAFTLRRRVIQAAEGRVSPFVRRMAGLTSLGLWTFVAVWARLIGLV
jgi:hypothetical protein